MKCLHVTTMDCVPEKCHLDCSLKAKQTNTAYVNRDCYYFDYGDTCPTAYGAFCKFHKCAIEQISCAGCQVPTLLKKPPTINPGQVNLALYAKDVLRTWKGDAIGDFEKQIIVAALGLNNEAGEAGDIIKKHVEQGQPLNREKLIEELGDTYFYFTLSMLLHGITLEEVVAKNVVKRLRRYPDGFSTKAAIERRDVNREK